MCCVMFKASIQLKYVIGGLTTIQKHRCFFSNLIEFKCSKWNILLFFENVNQISQLPLEVYFEFAIISHYIYQQY